MRASVTVSLGKHFVTFEIEANNADPWAVAQETFYEALKRLWLEESIPGPQRSIVTIPKETT